MKALLIDNWTITKAIGNFSIDRVSTELKRIMGFMVLWDEVYYLDNEYASWWKECVRMESELSFLNNLKPLKPDDVYDNDINKEFEKYKDKYNFTVARGAIEYLLYADTNGMQYAPVDERADFIEKSQIVDMDFSRNEIIKYIDSELLAYYKRSAEKIKKANIDLGFETIYGLIESKKKTDTSYEKKITSLKNSMLIKSFRSWIDDFENTIKSGKELNIDDYYTKLARIIKEQETVKIQGTIGLVPFEKPSLKLLLRYPLKGLTPGFLFPSYLYKRGIKNSKEIVFHKNDVSTLFNK